MSMAYGNLFTIPSSVPFARALAKGILEEAGGDPSALPRLRILLPTRRACRAVREAFLQESGGAPLLLPRLQPLGDVEEEELALTTLATASPDQELLSLPPAVPPLLRRILLARAIMKLPDFSRGMDQALALADELARLMDQIHTEGLDLGALPGLVTGDMARHWEVTTDFLKILGLTWPAILASQGMIDPADRRNRLLRALARHWRDNPPPHPVIAAGSTGSIPATADLLTAIAGLPQGRIVLPGLDQSMDQGSWNEVGDTHPQNAFKNLLARLGAQRENIRIWPASQEISRTERRYLATEMMRPAETTDRWNEFPEDSLKMLRLSTAGLERHDCETPEEEARLIALIFRRTLEEDGRTAALVTPDRALARRVAMACRRWGLTVDDSAGQDLQETAIGVYLRLVIHAVVENLSPGVFLALLRHRFCRSGTEIAILEKTLLRGPKPPRGFTGLRSRAAALDRKPARLEEALALIDRLEPLLNPLLALMDRQNHPAGLWIETHIKAAESLAGGADALWQGEAGEAAASFLASLQDAAAFLPPMDGKTYFATLERLMKTVAVRPRYGTHPRLAILGQLEARLLQADTVVLSGLNEKSWPPDPGHDPWMSRPMRAAFGLPSPEQGIGLAAHDFVQSFCASHVVLTRSLRQDNAPTVPSRWLQRLDTVLQAAGLDPGILSRSRTPWMDIVRSLDRSITTNPCPRPMPCPPVERRPKELPVTQVEKWLQDPYSIYARYILRLRKLEPLERPPDEAARGSFLHAVLNDFATLYGDRLPPDAEEKLVDLGVRRLGALADDSSFWQYWMPRFRRIARWICLHEEEWRTKAAPLLLEAEGRMVINGFTLTARADRIDRFRDGHAAIIDYKTGGTLSAKAVVSGRQPQLALEALILQRGGFEKAGPLGTDYLGYWKLTGGARESDIVQVKPAEIPVAIANAENGLAGLIAAYADPAMPYFSLPDPDRVPRFQDYAHLARVQEWSVADEQEGGE